MFYYSILTCTLCFLRYAILVCCFNAVCHWFIKLLSDLIRSDWLQASLPVKEGCRGLDVCDFACTCTSCLLASPGWYCVWQRLFWQTVLVIILDILVDSLLEQFQKHFLPSSPSGTGLVFLLTEMLLKPHWLRRFSELLFGSFLAPHSGDWLSANANYLLWLEARRRGSESGCWPTAGSNLCVPHQCKCRSLVNTNGVYNLVCKRLQGITARAMH